MNSVFFEAEKIGNVYRGLVIDSKTLETISITAYTYLDRDIAMAAARRMHLEAQEVVA
jgi:hypothetical protein